MLADSTPSNSKANINAQTPPVEFICNTGKKHGYFKIIIKGYYWTT